MKKGISALCVIVGVLGFGLTTFASGFDTSLKYGDSGSSVTELQEFLVSQNINVPVTGNFYSLTLQGVKTFQTNNGISPVSGYFGSLSRAKANDLLDLADSDKDEVGETGLVSVPTTQPTIQVPAGVTLNSNVNTSVIPNTVNTNTSAANTQQTTVVASLPFSITTIDKGTYVIFKENNSTNVVMQGVTFKLPNNNYVNDASGQLYMCSDVLSYEPNYPYPCPITGGYETKSSVDNYGRSTPFDIDGMTLPEGTTIYYYKAIDNNGNVYTSN